MTACTARVGDTDLADVRLAANRVSAGVQIAAAAAAVIDLPAAVRPEQADATRAIATVLAEAMSDHRSDERVAVSGTDMHRERPTRDALGVRDGACM